MSSLKRALVVAFVASVSLIPVYAGAQEPEFRYFTPHESILNAIENGEDVRGYKLCATEGWSPPYAAKPDVVKGFGVLFVPSASDAVLTNRGGACDLVALPWSEGKEREQSQKALKSYFQPIPSLNGG
ncbi:hypothetical protein [Nitratireductor sp. OM-1]|uniref:hypothetical protein n=1 Tax=Nitratireductor sp. OM-1 TaxID=1756988 RepID=UPI000DDC90DF|nr:hypothetical protein [Nitratireductor sp. OM-1]